MKVFNIHNLFSFIIKGMINEQIIHEFNMEFGYFASNNVKSPDLEIFFEKSVPNLRASLFPIYKYSDSVFEIDGVQFTPSVENFTKIIVDSTVNIDDLIYYFIEPIMFLKLLQKGCTFLHSSAICKNGDAFVFCAWPHTGKTNTLISFYAYNSNANTNLFLADELSIISNKGMVYPYPRPIKVFSYNLMEFPELLRKLQTHKIVKSSIKIRYLINDSIEQFRSNKHAIIKRNAPLRFLTRALTFLFPVVSLKISPTDIGWKIGTACKLKKLFLLKKSLNLKGVKISEVENKIDFSIKLAVNFLWERDFLLKHYLVWLFAFPNKRNYLIERCLETQKDIIYNAIKKINCYCVSFQDGLPFKKVFKSINEYLND